MSLHERNCAIDSRVDRLQREHMGGGNLAYSLQVGNITYLLTDGDHGVDFAFADEIILGAYDNRKADEYGAFCNETMVAMFDYTELGPALDRMIGGCPVCGGHFEGNTCCNDLAGAFDWSEEL
jgi:hypothetical protein